MAEFAVNNSVSASTGHTPFYTVYASRHTAAPIDIALNTFRVPAAAELRQTIDRITSEVQHNMTKAQERQAEYVNARRREVQFSVGQEVLVSTVNMKLPSTKSSKFKQRYLGPFEVMKVINPVAYKRLHPVFHVSLLKPYRQPESAPPPPEPLDAERMSSGR